jgi:hypothetical protein
MDPLSESPMETRVRLLLVLAGLPRPTSQFVVRDALGGFVARADFAFPVQRLIIEYDGALHWEQRRQDDRRLTRTPVDLDVDHVKRRSKREQRQDRRGLKLVAAGDASDEGRLPGVLQAVGDDAHQPDTEGDRRVPALVDDPLEVGIGEPFDEPNRSADLTWNSPTSSLLWP